MTAGIILSIVGCIGMAAVGVSQVYKGIAGTIEEIKKAKAETVEDATEEKEA